MSETRKNHLNIDGGQVTADDNIASYKPIPEADSGLISKKSKSKEKISDEAEEKLLKKEDEAKIVTRVDMADAKYIVEDHRNGDAKIELDANKKQFSGLTKEELLKYAGDPFWIRLRWFMFIMFWALWFAMLAGAVAIIVLAPKCAAPVARQWYEKGPVVELDKDQLFELSKYLPALQSAKVEGVYINGDDIFENTYDILDEDQNNMQTLKDIVAEAKGYGIRVVVDVTPNYVSNEHAWFKQSENRSIDYSDYFIWAKGRDFNENGTQRDPPNNWISILNIPAWSKSDVRNEFYLHQYGADQPDLNFRNVKVVKHFDDVLVKLMKTGVAGVRLHKARQLLVNMSFPDEAMSNNPNMGLNQYASLQHRHTSDQADIDELLQHWAHIVDSHAIQEPNTGATVFTMYEEGDKPELWLLDHNTTSLRPISAAPIDMMDIDRAVERLKITEEQNTWPAIKLVNPRGIETHRVGEAYQIASDLAVFAMLLPASPVLKINQITDEWNNTIAADWLPRMTTLRVDASIEHGNVSISSLADNDVKVIACLRWKSGHTGYGALWNGNSEAAHINLSALPTVPSTLTVVYASPYTQELTNYTSNRPVDNYNVTVPAKSTVVLSYVPNI